MKRAKRTSARFSAVMEFARVPEQVETCESTREKQTSVVTDGNRRKRKEQVRGLARFRNLRGYGRVAEGKAERNVVEWRPSVSGLWNTRLRKEFAPMMKKKGFAGRIKNHDRHSE